MLERLLDRPSSADCQEALAAHLWERGVFEPRETETVVMVARISRSPGRRRLRTAVAGAMLAVAGAVLVHAVRDPGAVVRATERLVRLEPGVAETLSLDAIASRGWIREDRGATDSAARDDRAEGDDRTKGDAVVATSAHVERPSRAPAAE